MDTYTDTYMDGYSDTFLHAGSHTPEEHSHPKEHSHPGGSIDTLWSTHTLGSTQRHTMPTHAQCHTGTYTHKLPPSGSHA